MKSKYVIFFLLLLALLGYTTESRRAAMRGRLSALNALNRADSVLTASNRDEALSLVDFFDRHGTANEQMLAHYLLGRCYADMHEAPMALHCYQEAISSVDCDFAQPSVRKNAGIKKKIMYNKNSHVIKGRFPFLIKKMTGDDIISPFVVSDRIKVFRLLHQLLQISVT